MNTELILYSQQLFSNPKFANSPTNYGWDITGTWTKSSGKITKSAGSLGQIRQDGILIVGVEYRLKFIVTNRSAGQCFIMNQSGGTVHQTVSADGAYTIDFVADAEDLIFDCNSAFNGAFQNASIISLPERYDIELNGNEAIPFNFNVDDILNLGKRKTTWTKTITIPGTNNNNVAFGHIYKINGEGLFDPRLKARAVIKSHGIVLFDGWLSLDSITKFPTSYCNYHVSLTGDSIELFSRFGEKSIKDMDFSAYDHPFTTENLLFNWGAYDTGSLIGTIPACCQNSSVPNVNICTDTYTAPVISSISSTTFDGIARVGITFMSAHSFSALDEIHIAANNDRLGGTHIIADIPSTTKITLFMGWAQLTDTSTPNASTQVTKRTWDGFGYFYPLVDNGSWHKTLTEGSLKQGALYTVTVEDLGTDDFSNLATDPITGAPVTATEGTTFLADDGISAMGSSINPTIWSGNTELIVHELEENGAVLESKERSINHWYANDLVPCIFVREIWDKMVELIDYEIDCDLVDTPLFKRLVMPLDPAFNVVADNGAWVHMNDWLPGMKLKDFFTSILNMFNLVIIEDKEVTNKISLVSRNTFYDDSNDVTWQLHAGEGLTIKLANTLLPQYYHLKYKDSTDFYNVDFNNEIGDIGNTSGIQQDIDRKYGDYYLPSGNQFSDKSNKVEISFEPTVMAGPLTQSPGGIYLDSDKTISVCYYSDDEGVTIQRKQANRILIAGFRGTDNAWSITSTNVIGAIEDFDFKGNREARFFPYAAHIDNIFDGRYPYHDLNFGALQGQYFSHTFNEDEWNEHTLVGKYWSRHLNEVTNKNSKHVTATIKLSINDVYRLDFRNLVRPENTDFLLKLQKVKDWDINSDGVCKCEFLLKN